MFEEKWSIFFYLSDTMLFWEAELWKWIMNIIFPSDLWNCGCHMTAGCITPVNPLLTAGKWTYLTYFSLHTAEIGVHHPPWPMTCLQIILIQSIGYLLHRYQKMETQIQSYHVIRFPQINSNNIIHNNRYNYIRRTVHCLIFIYISFQICLIFLSK